MKKLIGVLVFIIGVQFTQFAQNNNSHTNFNAFIKNENGRSFSCSIVFEYGELDTGDSIRVSIVGVNDQSYILTGIVSWKDTQGELIGDNKSDVKAIYYSHESDNLSIDSDTLKTDFPTNVQVNVFRSRGGVELNNITIYFDENGIGYERVLGTGSVSESELVKFYPNPVSNNLNYSNEIKIIQIVDSKGKTVPFVLLNNQIDVSMLHIGEYIVQYEYDNQIFTKTFIKE